MFVVDFGAMIALLIAGYVLLMIAIAGYMLRDVLARTSAAAVRLCASGLRLLRRREPLSRKGRSSGASRAPEL